MAKPDFPALLLPGLHVHTLESVESLAVSPFPRDTRRTILFNQLLSWVRELQTAKVTARIWIDGSFLTEKPGPDDIDCIVWSPQFVAPPASTDVQSVQKLMDKSAARMLFDLDLYLETPTPELLVHREAYWKGFFGYCHDRVTAKGFAELRI